MSESLLNACGVLYVDHLAVTTPCFEETLREYLALPGARLSRGPGSNPAQHVRYAFVQLSGGLHVEILAPEDNSPIARHVANGGGPYHFCHAVADLAVAIGTAERLGARVVSAPQPDVAFDGRRVAFLFHEALGVFELVEAFHGSGAQYTLARTPARSPATADERDVRTRLHDTLTAVFPELTAEDVQRAAINATPGWDSLAQIRLVMEVESRFGISIPAERIAELTSCDAIFVYLEQALS